MQMDDIWYLGRGVSGQLYDRRSNSEQLATLGLPVLSSPAELADSLQLTLGRLRWLSFHAAKVSRPHYVRRSIPKSSGGERLLSIPRTQLRAAQEWIRQRILDQLPAADAAHGFVPGRGVLTNAIHHCGQLVLLQMDLENFFPSIGFGRVRAVFRAFGYSPAAASILALLCTECPRICEKREDCEVWVQSGPRGLPQGASTSPGLSNLVCRRLDRRLGGLAAKLQLNYTRYADDLTFSGDRRLERRLGWMISRVREIAESEGFRIREEKTRVRRQNAAQKVTGLVVNARPGVSRAEVRRLRAILHHALSDGIESQNREGRSNFRAWLLGKIAWVNVARPEAASRLRRAFEQADIGERLRTAR
jgi:retron-type reverse transcriptase